MCGGESNHVESFFAQLASRFPLTLINQHEETSFIVNAYVGRTNRKVCPPSARLSFTHAAHVAPFQIEFIPVSFHSYFAMNLDEFDGFILFHDRDRKAAINTMTYAFDFVCLKRHSSHA